jgi:hypothetical protein
MARKKGPITLSESELLDETLKRLANGGHEFSRAQARTMLTALKEELVDCVTSGYKVNLTGVLTIEPVLKAGRKKGTVIRNPFDPDAKPRTLKADEPDKFAVKVSKSTTLNAKFPTVKSKAGQELADQLRLPAKKKRAAA